MKILAIESSCDDSAVSLVEATGILAAPKFRVLAEAVSSQIALHQQFGGVVPMLAKREHAKNLIPLLRQVLNKGKRLKSLKTPIKIDSRLKNKIDKLLEREPELIESFWQFLPTITKPKINYLAVTAGPGLEPTLWVGINLAKALSLYWDIPLLPVNHLEGHLVSPLLVKNQTIKFPALAVIISGGHTEMVLAKKFGDYKIIGQTRDDAVGEAFDKVARLMGLPYPGGPEISKLAQIGKIRPEIKLPRPMINSKDYDFSFSGLKTAVLYLLPKLGPLTEEIKAAVALEFESAVAEVLLHKTLQATKTFKAKTIIVGGGVIANKRIRATFQKLARSLSPRPVLLLPAPTHTGDNAAMIAAAAYLNLKKSAKFPPLPSGQKIQANGNLNFK